MKTIDDLIANKACKSGLIYARQHSTLAEAWNKCERGDWMWWLLRMDKVAKEISVAFAKDCTNRARDYAAAYAIAAAAAAYAAAATYASAATYATYAAAAASAAAADAATADDAAADAADAAATYAAATTIAATADDAAYSAYRTERLHQANFLRSLVPNPFL
jgi:hypothetical protein